jgi:hypothetical protein
MPKKVVVTGYIPIKNHTRSPKEYGELGELFGKIDCVAADCTVMPFYETVEETWLSKHLRKLRGKPSHSGGDNPAKNSLAYHCVNHQKFGWLMKAAIKYPAETYIWIDYGIARLPGVTAQVVQRFLEAVEPNDFAIPGCWEREGVMVSDFFPCWRFCGSLMVVPKDKVYRLYREVKRCAIAHIDTHDNVPWEVNTLADAESALPGLRWYLADHNASMFNNYKEVAHAIPAL